MSQSITLFFLTFLCSSLVGWTQNYEIDRLKEEIASQSDDSLKVNNLILLSNQYLGVDPNESVRYGIEAQKLANKLHYKGEAYAYKAVGNGYYYLSDNRNAALQFQNSLKLFDSLGYKVGVANILSTLGSTYFNAGEGTKAIDFFLRSLKI